MHLKIALLVFTTVIAGETHAQLWKKKKAPSQDGTAVQQPTSLNPSSSTRKEYAPREPRKSLKGPTYGLEQEYYGRMEAVEKSRRKNERLMEKPQYSDPLYFGHKRPPKKRKPSRMKYCKECGIRH